MLFSRVQWCPRRVDQQHVGCIFKGMYNVVIVHSGTSLQSSDHDFTTSSIIPSAVLLSEIPADTSESWYDGEVKVMFNEGAFI